MKTQLETLLDTCIEANRLIVTNQVNKARFLIESMDIEQYEVYLALLFDKNSKQPIEIKQRIKNLAIIIDSIINPDVEITEMMQRGIPPEVKVKYTEGYKQNNRVLLFDNSTEIEDFNYQLIN